MASVTVTRNFTASLEDFVAVPAEDMRDIGLFVRELIYRRTIRGTDANGAPFAPYSEAYAKAKGSTHVDLTVSGNMLNHMQVVAAEDNKVTLGWTQ